MADRPVKSGVMILKTYFGVLDGQTNAHFVAELKELSPSDRDELTTLAAAELGVDIKAS